MKKYDSSNKKSCSVLSIILILLFVFILLLAGAFYLKFKVKVPEIATDESSTDLSQNVKKQLDDQSGESIVSIRVTETDLSGALNTSSENFPLKKSLVKITPEKIILSGRTSNSPLSFKVDVGIIPNVVGGKTVLEINEIKTGGVSAPKAVTDEINKNLSSYLSQYNLNDNIKVTEIKLYQGYLIATGERKV